MSAARELFPPRTIRDFIEMELFVHDGLSNREILDRMLQPWGSEVGRFHGRDFCRRCEQFIDLDYCIECYQPIPYAGGAFGFLCDLELVVEAARFSFLGTVAKELARNGISKRLTVYLISALNFQYCKPALNNYEVRKIVYEGKTA